MIDAHPSLAAAESLPGYALAGYLRDKGWSARPSRLPGMTILTLSLPDAEEDVRLVLPERAGFSDEQRRVADALRAVESIEGRPLALIAGDAQLFAQSGSGAKETQKVEVRHSVGWFGEDGAATEKAQPPAQGKYNPDR